ncbi:MAG: FtsX-like permease family protein [Cyclobacteriaceae bacterium]
MSHPWREILIGSASVLGAILGLLLVVSKYPASKWLGLLCLIFVSIGLLAAAQKAIVLYGVIVPFSVCLFLYAQAFFQQKRRIAPWHVLPIALIIIFVFVPSIPAMTVRIVSLAVSIGYTYMTIRLVLAEGRTRGIQWWINPGSRLVWFRNFILGNLVFVCFCLTYPELPFGFLSGLLFLLLVYITYQIFNESAFFSPIPVANKYQKSTLNPAIKSAILSKLDHVFDGDQFHLRDDASLSSLAHELGATTHHLSQVLNESKQISFQDLLAQYRIRDAKKLLKDKAHQQTKIESIAAMVGYNSKSAFNTAFKKRTGHTPSEFRAKKEVLTYREERLPHKESSHSTSNAFSLNHSFSSITKTDMIQNFFKSFLRNIRRNKLFTAINLFGLTLAFVCSMFIYLFIANESSYDQHLLDYDQLYRIAWMSENPQTRTPHPMAQAMVQDWPEVEQAVSISPWFDGGLNREKILVENFEENIQFEEDDFFFADSTFFEMFGIEVLEGDAQALAQPFTLVITDEIARKYFGEESAVGKELRISDMPMMVSTVVKALPENTHFHFDALLSYMTLKTINPEDNWLTWDDFGHFNYVKLKEGVDPKVLEGKLTKWAIDYREWSEEDKEVLQSGAVYFDLQPIADIHLKSSLRWELERNGNILYIYILTGTLIFLLLIAAINYINLTTAKSLERAKEIGVRKTLGAVSRGLSVQFYMESIIFCLLAGLLAFILAIPSLEVFNVLVGKSLEIGSLFNVDFVGKAILVILMIGVIAGAYPAMVMSSFKPAEVLKGKLTTSSKGIAVRSVLVTLQFTISAILIAGSLIIVRQVNYMKNKELGFDQEAVLHMPIPVSVEVGGVDLNKMTLTQKRLQKLRGVIAVSASSNVPGTDYNQHPIYALKNPENRVDASEMMQDFGLKEVLNYEIIAGRDFDKSFTTDSSATNFILNESAVKALNLKNPVNEQVVWVDNDKEVKGTIIGVVKDFHYRSLHEGIQPLIIQLQPDYLGYFMVKLEGAAFASTLAEIEEIYAAIYPNNPFSYQFLENELAELYSQEQKTLSVFAVFAGIALILACLGLLGMAFTMLNQRVKEIGLRKIMGASPVQIAMLVLGQFAKLVLIAALIGLPISYILMQSWLMEFSYQAPLSVFPFLLSALILLVIAVLSVSSAVAKMAFSQPIDSLRYE